MTKGIIILFLFFFFLSPATAAEIDEKKKKECINFYDEREAKSKIAFENYNEDEIKKIEENYGREEAMKLSFSPFTPLFEISDKSKECGEHDSRYYETEQGLCSAFTSGLKNMSNEAKAYYFEKIAKPFFCKNALDRGDKITLMNVLRYYLSGVGPQKDYKKAIELINEFAEKHPNLNEVVIFSSPIYRRGGYGVEKDEAKAFEVLRNVADQSSPSPVFCELSLYYRNGVGIPKDEQEADKWLNVYKEKYPQKECKFNEYKFLFEEDYIKNENMEKPATKE